MIQFDVALQLSPSFSGGKGGGVDQELIARGGGGGACGDGGGGGGGRGFLFIPLDAQGHHHALRPAPAADADADADADGDGDGDAADAAAAEHAKPSVAMTLQELIAQGALSFQCSLLKICFCFVN